MTVQRRERALTPPPLPGIAREPLPNQPAAELVKVLLLRSRLPILHLTRVKADLSDGPPEQASRFVPVERLFPCTNCGMAPMDRSLAIRKLVALSTGAALARRRFDHSAVEEGCG